MLEANRVYAVLLDHPLFKYGVRRIRWGETAGRLRRYNFRAALIVHMLLIGLWLLLVASNLSNNVSGAPYYSVNYMLIGNSSSYIAFVMLISILMNFILDFASLVFSLNSIGGEVSAGRWDLLRMTPLLEELIVNAKHGLAQVRAWRVMAVVLYMRIAVLALLLLHVFLLPILTGGPNPLFDLFRYDFFGPLLALITGIIFLAVYVIEPVWRMRAMTALGLAVSARVHSIVFGLLTAFASIVITWIVQAIILGILAWLTVQILIGIYNTSLVVCGILFACIATGFIIRAFYIGLQGWGLGYATRRIYQESQR